MLPKLRRVLAFTLALLRGVILGVGVIALITAGACWLFGWGSLSKFGSTLIWAGLLAAAIGGTSASGTSQLLGSPQYWYAQSVMPESLWDRWRLNMRSFDNSVSVTVPVILSGLACMVLGFWIASL